MRRGILKGAICDLEGRGGRWTTRVWSGVPQGSVLGPILFLIFMNDIDKAVTSKVLKFADDTKLYRVVDNHQDEQRLQDDLDSVCDWADEWKMSFNVEKCKVVHYGKGSTSFTYRMHGQLLDEATSEKDLGVVFSNDLKVKQVVLIPVLEVAS